MNTTVTNDTIPTLLIAYSVIPEGIYFKEVRPGDADYYTWLAADGCYLNNNNEEYGEDVNCLLNNYSEEEVPADKKAGKQFAVGGLIRVIDCGFSL